MRNYDIAINKNFWYFTYMHTHRPVLNIPQGIRHREMIKILRNSCIYSYFSTLVHPGHSKNAFLKCCSHDLFSLTTKEVRPQASCLFRLFLHCLSVKKSLSSCPIKQLFWNYRCYVLDRTCKKNIQKSTELQPKLHFQALLFSGVPRISTDLLRFLSYSTDKFLQNFNKERKH